jgi:putative NADH-flavin reductase
MKIAVIGATGHLGSAVTYEATARGHQVSAVNVRSAGELDAALLARGGTALRLAGWPACPVPRMGGAW